MKILVLMSTYNGEKFLKEQIDSIINQKIDSKMKIELLVRDDGSSDSTKEILESYQKKNLLTWYEGENLKPAKSFWNLVMNAPEADFYAFCDQDDKWFDDKILRAVKQIGITNESTLYCSSVMATDINLNPLKNQMKTMEFTDFAHSLMYSLAPGCTFVFNKNAREQLIKYDMEKEIVLIHDWLAHKIIALKGNIIFDSIPTMYYRQHGNNVIGSQSGIIGIFNRFQRYVKDTTCIRSNVASSLLNVFSNELSRDSDEFKYLNLVANYRNDKNLKKMLLREKAFKTKSINDIFLTVLIRMGRI